MLSWINVFLSVILTVFTISDPTYCEDATIITPNEYCTFQEGNTEWFQFTTITPILVNVITSGEGDGYMELYKGSCDGLEFIQFDDNSGPFLMPQINFETESNTTYYVKVTGSDLFEICIFNCSPLPVELISYKAYNADTYLLFKWVTASESNNNYFTLYSSEDHVKWGQVSRIPGNNTTSLINYYSTSSPIIYNKTMYYKLTQTDYNGTEVELGVIPYFNKKELKKLIQQITVSGDYISKNYKGIEIKIYSDETIEKTIILNE